MDIRPLIDEEPDANQSTNKKGIPYVESTLETWFRRMRLSMLWNACIRASHHPHIEEPKQAVQKGLLTAVFTIVAVHLLPVSAALLLIAFNIHGYYIGGELSGPSGYDDAKLSGLQFAAKLHEVAMLSSLSVVVVGLIRHELLSGEGIPFGAVFGSLQFSNLSYLFSKEFAGTLRARFAKTIVKIRLIMLIIAGTILALTVGPSSAIAMRPRLDNWPAGGSDFYLNATVDEIWPLTIDASTIPTSCSNITVGTTCISRDWEFAVYQLLAYWPSLNDRATMPESLQINSPKSTRQVYTRTTEGLYPFFETVATTQMSVLADSVAEIGRLWAIAANELHNVTPDRPRRFVYRKEATYSLENVYQPVTAAFCRSQRNTHQLHENLSKNKVQVPIPASLCNQTYLESTYLIPPETSEMVAEFLDGSATSPKMKFIDLPTETFGNSTVGALITFPPSWPGGANILTCGVDARWVNVTVQSTRNLMKIVSGQPLDWPGNGACISSQPPIKVTSDWAQYLNPYNQDTNQSVFHALVESVELPTSQWRDDSGFVQGVMETILTTMVMNGLSRTASSATIQGQLKYCPEDSCNEICGRWCLDMMPKNYQEFGYGGNIYNTSDIPDLSKMSKFTVQVDVNGYAYNIKGATVVLSCVVLLCYCFLAVLHSVFVLIQRSSSNAWDSVSEVTALAMQSQPTEKLENTCAGISTTDVFSNLVKVVRTGGEKNHLELDFGDRGPLVGERVIEDDYYG